MSFFNNDNSKIEKPMLIIPLKSYKKIMAYAEVATGEITGFADVSYDKEKKALVVGEVYLLEQKAGGVDVEMDEETVANFNLQLIKQGINQLPRTWWHSHVNMDTFFSAIDDTTIDNLNNDSFIVALVVNKYHKMKALLKICEPIPLIINDLPISVDYGYTEIPKTLVKEVQRKVKEHKWELGSGEHLVDDEKEVLSLDNLDEKTTNISTVRFFSRNLKEIKKRIKKLKLKREWDKERSDYVWVNPRTGTIWIDFHQIIYNPLGDEFTTPNNDGQQYN